MWSALKDPYNIHVSSVVSRGREYFGNRLGYLTHRWPATGCKTLVHFIFGETVGASPVQEALAMYVLIRIISSVYRFRAPHLCTFRSSYTIFWYLELGCSRWLHSGGKISSTPICKHHHSLNFSSSYSMYSVRIGQCTKGFSSFRLYCRL